jgi:death-on-curing protein
VAVLVADNCVDKELLRRLIESLIFEEEYSEELKLELFHANSQFEQNRAFDRDENH